jgi:hypothetical protein
VQLAAPPATRPSPAALADTYASALCGKAGGFTAASGRKCNRVAHGTYAQMQGANGALWQRVRCLFADDFRLYNRAVCKQKWLRKCATCVARACA